MTENKPPLKNPPYYPTRELASHHEAPIPNFRDEFNLLSAALDLSKSESVKEYCEAAANLVRENHLSILSANEKIVILQTQNDALRQENSRLRSESVEYAQTKISLAHMTSSRDWHKEALVPWVQKLNNADKIPVKYVEIQDVVTGAKDADQLWNGAVHRALMTSLGMKPKTKNPQKVLTENIRKLFRVDLFGEIPLPSSFENERILTPIIQK